jgi:SP family arabinose:H+ symporter-like MFS transporter
MVMSVIAFLFVWKMVPETKGKTLEEIEKTWHKGTEKNELSPYQINSYNN